MKKVQVPSINNKSPGGLRKYYAQSLRENFVEFFHLNSDFWRNNIGDLMTIYSRVFAQVILTSTNHNKLVKLTKNVLQWTELIFADESTLLKNSAYSMLRKKMLIFMFKITFLFFSVTSSIMKF